MSELNKGAQEGLARELEGLDPNSAAGKLAAKLLGNKKVEEDVSEDQEISSEIEESYEEVSVEEARTEAQEEIKKVVGNIDIPDDLRTLSKDEKIDLAKSKGWKPRDEYAGDELDWKDAGAFLKDAKKIQEMIERGKKIDNLEKMFYNFKEHFETVKTKEIEELTAKYEQEKLDAKRVLDMDRFEQASTKLAELKKEVKEIPKAELSKDAQEALQAFYLRNKDWYSDIQDATPAQKAMVTYAKNVELSIRKENPDFSPHQLLREVETAVREQFPQQFGKAQKIPARTAPATVSAKTGKVSAGTLDDNAIKARLTKAQLDLFNEAMSSLPNYTLKRYYEELKKTGRIAK